MDRSQCDSVSSPFSQVYDPHPTRKRHIQTDRRSVLSESISQSLLYSCCCWTCCIDDAADNNVRPPRSISIYSPCQIACNQLGSQRSRYCNGRSMYKRNSTVRPTFVRHLHSILLRETLPTASRFVCLQARRSERVETRKLQTFHGVVGQRK